jgi:hypothetical protein
MRRFIGDDLIVFSDRGDLKQLALGGLLDYLGFDGGRKRIQRDWIFDFDHFTGVVNERFPDAPVGLEFDFIGCLPASLFLRDAANRHLHGFFVVLGPRWRKRQQADDEKRQN